MNDEPSHNNHATKLATSDGCPSRLRAMWSKFIFAPLMDAELLNIGVSMGPLIVVRSYYFENVHMVIIG